MIKLAIAEDHIALIDGIKVFLEYEEDIEFVGFAKNGQELLELARRKTLNLVVTDIRMPVMDGVTLTKQLIKEFPEINIIAFTMYDQDEAVSQMIKAGAKGYILKNASLKDLLFSIRQVHNGEHYYDPNINTGEIIQKPIRKGLLTRRQQEILKLIALGKTNQEIADELFVGKTTVETHRKNMIRKLHLSGVGELLRYALDKKYNF